jgi:tRNA(Ile)-lysidine synthase
MSIKPFYFPELITCSRILLAVSGGIDSMVMLHSIYNQFLLQNNNQNLGDKLFVITINHNIREKEESAGDAELVQTWCRQNQIICKIEELPPGSVSSCAQIRKMGTEDAARFLRYNAIYKYREEINADCICFAHNQNDQLETLLQRTFQGAILNSSLGIVQQREYVYRPLLHISREEIEAYAAENQVPYRTDKTNFETDYFRNKIRHLLIPVLNTHFIGWDTGLLHGAEKNSLISDFVNQEASKIKWEKEVSEKEMFLWTDSQVFFSSHKILQIQALYSALSFFSLQKRISYNQLLEFIENKKRVVGSGLEIVVNNNKVSIKKASGTVADGGFFAIIDSYGETQIGSHTFSAIPVQEWESLDFESRQCFIGSFRLPLLVRSKQYGDVILQAHNGHQEVKKIFSRWGVPSEIQNEIPLVLEKNEKNKWEVMAILGEPFGFQNWVVTHTSTLSNNSEKKGYLVIRKDYVYE